MSDTHDNPQLTLWGAGTMRTIRPHWVLHELGLTYKKHLIGSRTGETETSGYRALNPRGKIPLLQDGDFVLAESAAIINYLAEHYGAETGLVPPSGSRQHAMYDQWCFFIMTELDAHTLYVIRRHGDLANIYGEAPNAIKAAEHGFVRQVEVVAKALREGGPYLLGDTFTCADVLLTTCLIWADYCKIPVADVLVEYRKSLTARKAYRQAAAINVGPIAVTQSVE